jgi:hypothetical protein
VGTASLKKSGGHDCSGLELFDDLVTGSDASSVSGILAGTGGPAIRIVLDITRLVEEGKLTAQEAERLQALAKRDTGSLAINTLMSFGASRWQPGSSPSNPPSRLHDR